MSDSDQNDNLENTRIRREYIELAKARQDSISNPLTGLGGSRDKGVAANPVLTKDLTSYNRNILYEKNVYARKHVTEIVGDALRKGWDLNVDAESASELIEIERELQIASRVREAAINGRLHGNALLILVTDLAGGADLSEPLGEQEQLVNLVVVSDDEITPLEYFSDLTDRDHGKVKIWSVSTRSKSFRIHASRVVVFRGIELSNKRREERSGDVSVVDSAWDAIRGMTAADQSMDLALAESYVKALRVEGLKALQTSDRRQYFHERMTEISEGISQLRILLLGEGDELELINTPLSGMGDAYEKKMLSTSAATDIPITKLFGQAPSGLNSDGESQRENWNNRVSDYRTWQLQPALEQVYELIFRRPELEGVDWNLTFPALEEMSQLEESQIRKSNAEADQIYFTWGVYTPDHVAESRFGPDGYKIDLMPVETDTDRQDEKTFQPPESAVNNARQALEWKREHDVDAGTPTGWRTARRLAKGDPIPLSLVQRIAQFNRHRDNAEVETDEPWQDAGHVMWMAWGGDTGIDWAIEVSGRQDEFIGPSDPELPDEVAELPENERRVWVEAFNETFLSLSDESPDVQEEVSFQQAWAAVNRIRNANS